MSGASSKDNRWRLAALAIVFGITPLQAQAAAGSTPVIVAAADPAGLPMDELQRIRALVQTEMSGRHIPGGSFAIGLDGKEVWTEGFGLADLENDVAATPDTEYRTASIGKPFTATAAMELAEAGRLDLDAPIQKYCPKFPEKPWPVTTRNLLSMTAGIRHIESQDQPYADRHYDHVSDALDIFMNDPLKEQPNTAYRYSTWGYVVLGCVIEGASGESYLAHVQKTLLDPTGMAHTRDDDPAAIIPNRARGYVMEDGVLKNSRWVDMSSKLPAGGFVTTAPDLLRFLDAWMAGDFLSGKSMMQMLAPYKMSGGTNDRFGMGWFLDDYHGMRTGFFAGGAQQVSGIVFFVPEKKLAIVGLFNLENLSVGERVVLVEAMADVILGIKQANPNHWNF